MGDFVYCTQISRNRIFSVNHRCHIFICIYNLSEWCCFWVTWYNNDICCVCLLVIAIQFSFETTVMHIKGHVVCIMHYSLRSHVGPCREPYGFFAQNKLAATLPRTRYRFNLRSIVKNYMWLTLKPSNHTQHKRNITSTLGNCSAVLICWSQYTAVWVFSN